MQQLLQPKSNPLNGKIISLAKIAHTHIHTYIYIYIYLKKPGFCFHCCISHNFTRNITNVILYTASYITMLKVFIRMTTKVYREGNKRISQGTQYFFFFFFFFFFIYRQIYYLVDLIATIVVSSQSLAASRVKLSLRRVHH